MALALAAVRPDESVVQLLEQTAVRAQRRGGFEAACTALERAAQLSAEAEARAGRLAEAGQAAWRAASCSAPPGCCRRHDCSPPSDSGG